MEVLQKQSIENLLEKGIERLKNFSGEGKYQGMSMEKMVPLLEKEWNRKAHEVAEEWSRSRAKSLMQHSLYSAAMLFIGVSVILLVGGKNILGAGFFFIAGFLAGVYGTNVYHGRKVTIEEIFEICAVQHALDVWKFAEAKKYEHMYVTARENELLEKAKEFYRMIPESNMESVMSTDEGVLYRTYSHVGTILKTFQQG